MELKFEPWGTPKATDTFDGNGLLAATISLICKTVSYQYTIQYGVNAIKLANVFAQLGCQALYQRLFEVTACVVDLTSMLS